VGILEVRAVPVESLLSAFRTDPGRLRTNNEDLPLVDPARGVYGVIDGIGGQAAGEIAAGIARDVILQRLARPLGTSAERVREAIAIANNEIVSTAEGAPQLHGMACVATLAIVADGVLTIGHVGDTRLYLFRPDTVRKLTHDHSPVGEREDANELSEIEAMRHPRRNEVFRDIGSTRRDKDEEDFVEVIIEPFERDSAILLCSDGLTDMVSLATIDRLVRWYAGNPQDVVDALVTAANEAGGKDNITVVFVEGSAFSNAIRQQGTHVDPATGSGHSPAVDSRAAELPRVPSDSGAGGSRRPGAVARFVGGVLRSRTTWFSVGAVAGVIGALLLAWRVGTSVPDPRRTLIAGVEQPQGFMRIGEAMAAARPGDAVRVDPGVYQERVILREGVDLTARIPGTVTIARPSNASGEVVGLTMLGGTCGRVAGIAIESTAAQPLDVGVRVVGQGCTLELLSISGEMRAGVQVTPSATVTIRGSRFKVQGPALALEDESQATLAANTLMRLGRPIDTPFMLSPTSQVLFQENVFAGFGTEVVKGMPATTRQQLLAGNYVIASEPSLLR
jgi:PPM family protein phosphatase